jgi:hypothetical protein
MTLPLGVRARTHAGARPARPHARTRRAGRGPAPACPCRAGDRTEKCLGWGHARSADCGARAPRRRRRHATRCVQRRTRSSVGASAIGASAGPEASASILLDDRRARRARRPPAPAPRTGPPPDPSMVVAWRTVVTRSPRPLRRPAHKREDARREAGVRLDETSPPRRSARPSLDTTESRRTATGESVGKGVKPLKDQLHLPRRGTPRRRCWRSRPSARSVRTIANAPTGEGATAFEPPRRLSRRGVAAVEAR